MFLYICPPPPPAPIGSCLRRFWAVSMRIPNASPSKFISGSHFKSISSCQGCFPVASSSQLFISCKDKCCFSESHSEMPGNVKRIALIILPLFLFLLFMCEYQSEHSRNCSTHVQEGKAQQGPKIHRYNKIWWVGWGQKNNHPMRPKCAQRLQNADWQKGGGKHGGWNRVS